MSWSLVALVLTTSVKCVALGVLDFPIENIRDLRGAIVKRDADWDGHVLDARVESNCVCVLLALWSDVDYTAFSLSYGRWNPTHLILSGRGQPVRDFFALDV